MKDLRNIHYAIVRRILILACLCIFLIAQNISGIIHEYKSDFIDKIEIRWEFLLVNMSEIILIILYYSQIDMDTSEHFNGEVWNKFVNGYVLKSYYAKMFILVIITIFIPILIILYSLFENNYYLFLSSIILFSFIYIFIVIDSFKLYRNASKATNY
jgi:hypothetical protein